MGLGVGKRPTSPTVPMILAARMGAMPKISVRVVPEASTSASMRPFSSAIFLSSVRTSRSTSEADRRLRRVEAPPCGRMPRRMRAARSAESVPATPPGRRSRRSPCRRLSTLVRSATRSSRLSESRRSTSEAASWSTAASLSLGEAAKAVARASRPSFLRALPAAREHPHPRRKLGRHVHHGFAGRYQPPRQVPTEAAGVLYGPTRSGNRFAQRSRALNPARFCGKLARSRSSPWLRRPPRRPPTLCGDLP